MRRTTDIEPSWEVFEACRRCGAERSAPYLSMRGVPKGWVLRPDGRAAVRLANSHPGRKKLPR
jgi:hypothetical protein